MPYILLRRDSVYSEDENKIWWLLEIMELFNNSTSVLLRIKAFLIIEKYRALYYRELDWAAKQLSFITSLKRDLLNASSEISREIILDILRPKNFLLSDIYNI